MIPYRSAPGLLISFLEGTKSIGSTTGKQGRVALTVLNFYGHKREFFHKLFGFAPTTTSADRFWQSLLPCWGAQRARDQATHTQSQAHTHIHRHRGTDTGTHTQAQAQETGARLGKPPRSDSTIGKWLRAACQWRGSGACGDAQKAVTGRSADRPVLRHLRRFGASATAAPQTLNFFFSVLNFQLPAFTFQWTVWALGGGRTNV